MTTGHRMALTLFLPTCFLLIGCRFPHKVGVNESGAPIYQTMSLTYEIEQPLAVPARSPIQLVSAEAETMSADEPDFADSADPLLEATGSLSGDAWYAVRLHIQYPHPENRPDFARVTLRLKHTAAGDAADNTVGRSSVDLAGKGDDEDEGDGSWSERLRSQIARLAPSISEPETPQRDDEIWALDLPKVELDLVLIDLANSGFFDQQARPHATAQITVDLDRGHESKAWTSESSLDELMRRVLRDGWLAGLVETDTDGDQSTGWFL